MNSPESVHGTKKDGTSQVPSPWGLRQRVGLVLGPLLFAGASAGLQARGWEAKEYFAAATVTLMATWWITETLPLWATACLPLVLFPLFGSAPAHEVALQYFDPLNFLFLGGMLIAASMQQWGLHRRIALGIVVRIGTSPRRIVLGFMVATAFVSLWIANTTATLMMFPIALAVLKKFEEQPRGNPELLRRFGLALMLGVAYAASLGGIGTKIGTGTNAICVKQLSRLEGTPWQVREIDFLTWSKVGIPVLLVSIPLVWLYLTRIAARLPPGDFPGGREAVEKERRNLGPLGRGEVVALVAFLGAALLWMFRKKLELGPWTVPGWSDLVPFTWPDVLGRPLEDLPKPFPELLRDTGDAAVAVGVGAALLLVPVFWRPLRFGLDLRNAAGISWGLLALLGGGFAMAYGMQRSGVTAHIAELLRGVGHLHPFVGMLLICFVSTALTEVASNTATASMLLPLLAASADSFGLHPAPLMFAATLSASFGFMLPAGTPPNAIVFSSGCISVPQMARCGLAVDLAGVVLVSVVCYLLAPWALGM